MNESMLRLQESINQKFDRAFRFIYPTEQQRSWVAMRYLQRKRHPELKPIEHDFTYFKIRGTLEG